jgi:3-deoxy-D-manno-octulosonic-acid transferase
MIYGIGYVGYHLGLWLYAFAVNCAAFFLPKAALFVNGRKGLLERVQSDLSKEQRQRVWFHCASLGEFEQARPIIELLKQKYPQYAIVITFFSPSGYVIRKNYALADYVYYLPLDSQKNASTFIAAVKPKLSFFVKYEVWYHYLNRLKNSKLPVFLISANFRQNHIYFKWYGAFFRKMLQQFTHIFCQNEFSDKLLLGIGYKQSSVSKDTRFDRVFEHVQQVNAIETIESFVVGKQVLVAGSSYAKEEQIIAAALSGNDDWKIIIAPHHIQPERITAIEKQFAKYITIRYSQLPSRKLMEAQVLIVDNIGLLSSIYQYASCAFIGGGFGKSGLHNMLEAAAFGMPILIGPNNLQKFPESLDLINAGACFVVQSSVEVENLLHEWKQQPTLRTEAAQLAKRFISEGRGATNHIMVFVDPILRS